MTFVTHGYYRPQQQWASQSQSAITTLDHSSHEHLTSWFSSLLWSVVEMGDRRHYAFATIGQGVPQRWSKCWILPRTMWIMLLALGSSEPTLFIGIPRLLREDSYLWHVRVVIYKRATTDRIHHICQVVEAPTPRWMFEVDMREAA
jgi:hypothetical protein